MKTYLVTGAAGFIGSALAKKIIENGHKVVTIDNLSTGYRETIPEDVIFYEGNCQDEKIINQLKKYQFETIYHIAGQSSGEISFENPVYDLQTNTQSTLLLLKLALETNCKKFIYASTMSVYGVQPDKNIDETVSTLPKSFYGVGKIASEHYMRIYQEYGINSTALRLFNVYGPGQNLKNMKQGMVSIFLAQAINNKHIHVKGSKDRFRDFIYIDDVIDAFLKAENKKQNSFDILNVCTGKKTTIEELINIQKQSLPYDDVSVEYTGSTPGDQFGIFGNNAQIKKQLNWQPKINLTKGIENMTNWALKQIQQKK